MKFRSLLALGALFFAGTASAATINVPADQSTIQAAINAATNGDTVLVAPGIYFELLDFMGKAIKVQSSGGAAVTILDGNNTGPIVSFIHGESSAAVLQGFTLTHAHTNTDGSAVHISGPSSPIIEDNVFVNNVGYSGYSGVAIGVSGGTGSPIILRNYFADNACGTQFEDSVLGFPADSPVIADNVFVNNSCPAMYLAIASSVATKVYNNTLVGNRYGIVFQKFSSTTGPSFFSNNLIAFNQYGLNATLNSGATMPTWSHNLVFGNTGADYQGVANQTGGNGNVSSDPMLKYWLGGDVHLLSSSPAIDAGDSTVSQTSATDFYSNTRDFDGNADGTAVVDIGAAENVTSDDVPGIAPVINVPTDQPTIQAAIDAASDGYVVLVAPGTYYEQLDFKGKPITVKSSDGPAVTILDGNNGGPIVNFHTSEWVHAVLQGFTLTHALQGDVVGYGPAVNVGGSSPTIEDNVFVDNDGSTGAVGGIISGNVASPVILRNYFTGSTCGFQLYDSVIGFGNASSPVIADNVFANNPCPAFVQILTSGAAPKVYNNTFVGNRDALLIYFSSNTAGVFFSNNLIAFNQYGLNATFNNGATLSTWTHNLVYGNTVADYQGVTNQTSTNGNTSSDPKLKDWADGNVKLLWGSPAIDVGAGTVNQDSATDFDGDSRVFDGNADGTSAVDIGAIEYHPPLVSAADGIANVTLNIKFNGALGVTNADPSEPFVFSLVALPTHGTVTLKDATTGEFQYVPVRDYVGPDGFAFNFTDPYGVVSNTATEQVSVNDVAPIAGSGSVKTQADMPVVGTLSITLGYAGQTLSVSLVSHPMHGRVSLDPASGNFKYTPTQGYAGADSFTFEAMDTYGTVSNVATESVTVTDVVPSALSATIIVHRHSTYSGFLKATAAYRGQALTYSVASAPASGSMTITDASTGAFTYTYTGAIRFKIEDSFTFKVVDQWGTASNIATVNVVSR